MTINKLITNDTPLDLKADWIWTPGRELVLDDYARFRGVFNADDTESPATITIANTCGEYDLWVNGRWVGKGGCPSTPEVHFGDTHDISGQIISGRNVVAIRAHGYCTGGQWWTFSPSGLKAEVRIGDKAVLGTSGDWKASTADEYSRHAHRFLFFLGFAEIVDLRREQPDWMQPDFDDIEWAAAELCRELGEHVIIPRETALHNYTTRTAKPTSGGRWLCPQGIQTINLAAIVADHGPGCYRITSYTMTPGLPADMWVYCESDFALLLNGEKVEGYQASSDPNINRYNEQRYHKINTFERFEPVRVQFNRGWNEVVIEVDADERSSHISLNLLGTFMRNTMPLYFSASKSLDAPGWRVEKSDGTVAGESQALDHTADVLSQWHISMPDASAREKQGDIAVEPGRYHIFDLGRVMSGRVTLDVSAAAGTTLDLVYAEWISDYDKVLQAAHNRYGDRIICREGRQQFQTVARRGVRFVKLLNAGGSTAQVHGVSVLIDKVVGEPVGKFECSDDLLNRIFKVSVDTLDVSLLDHPVDCPTRENGQYPGDNYVEAMQMFYLYDDLRIMRKGIRQFARVQEENGFFPGMTPAEWRHSLVDYSMIWVSWIAEHYRHTGDSELVREMLPYMERLFGFYRSFVDSDHSPLLRRISTEHYWLFLDHSPIDRRGVVCGFNAWYARALDTGSWLAAQVGDSDKATRWGNDAAAIAEAARRLFWDGELGLYRDCFDEGELSPSVTLQTNVIALYTDLATAAQHDIMTQRMWRPHGSKIMPELTSMNPYFQHYVLRVLAKLGRFGWGLRHIRETWGLMLDCGATTNWECFQSTGPIVPTQSLCHPWSGAPAYWLPANVLGVQPAQPGWSKVRIRPQATEGIEWARGTVPTPHGPIRIEWKQAGTELDVSVELPEGVSKEEV